MQPIELLMIDDDIDNYNSLKNAAARNRIILRYSNNLEEGINLLRSDKKLLGVILDGKGFINIGQQKGSESESFINKAMTELAVLELEQNRRIPRCVLTAWYDQLINVLDGLIKVYDKKKIALDDNHVSELFSYMRNEVINNNEFKIRKDFEDVFKVIGKDKFTEHDDSILYGAITLLKTREINKSSFNDLRGLLESFFVALNRLSPNILPDDLFKNPGKPNLNFCTRFLKGMQVKNGDTILYSSNESGLRIPSYIAYAIEYVKECSSSLSHNNSDYNPWNFYTYRANIYALCEILIWFNKHAESKKSE